MVAGGTEITGGDANGTWTVGGTAGTVTIEADKITGSAASVALTAGGNAAAEIKVTAATIKVDGVAVTVVIGTYGKVTLVGSATPTDVAHLLLKGGANPGSLVADSTQATTATLATTTTAYPGGTQGDTDAAVTGTGIVVKAAQADISTAQSLGSISGGTKAGDNDATISAPSKASNSAFVNGAKVITAG